jgi:tRNA nucleotidyltransferase/poly(A) polymerase
MNPNAIGTIQDDAIHRDITINGLYYNLQTLDIEDYTKRGLDDLRNKIIRTTISPYNTFMLNPIRILRVVRFACRLNFSIHPDIMKCMQEHSHLLAVSLKKNIVPSRNTQELIKMLMDNSYEFFVRSIYFLYKWKVLPTVVLLPETNVFSYQRKRLNKTKENNQRRFLDFQSSTPEGRKNRALFFAGGVWKSLFAFIILPLLNGQQSLEGKEVPFQFDLLKSKLNDLLTNADQHKYFM